jgi:hypothetical protein
LKSTLEDGEPRGASDSSVTGLSNINRFQSEFLNFASSIVLKFSKVESFKGVVKQCVKKKSEKPKTVGLISHDESISGIIEEEGFEEDIIKVIHDLEDLGVGNNWSNPVEAIVELHARELYEEVLEFA